MRALFMCQLCGEFYGDEQLKFYQHLKQHYEPHDTIIIENPVPVPDLGIDKMTNTCIVDNAANLPDSIVELSLENTVPKTMYQPIDKHILYTSSDKTLNYHSNKVQYSEASMDKEVPESEKADMYEPLDKLENMYFCTKCNKSFRKQKQCEVHIKEAHSNPKLDDMGEFSEPEDLMEGIHVAVDDAAEPYEPPLLPHLTVDNGHVHQEHVRTCEGKHREETCMPESSSWYSKRRVEPTNLHWASVVNYCLNPSHCGRRSVLCRTPIHKRVHNDDRPCKCDECGREFRQWSDLKYHKASIHSNKKNFKCEFCGKEFARRYSLSVHRRIHTGERNYKCDYCSKTFRASSYRLSHMRTHTGSKPYKCTQCEKCFRVAYDLRRHMLIHDKVRVRLDEHKGKTKDIKDKKPNLDIKLEHNPKQEPKSPESEEMKTDSKLPILKSLLDKKPSKSKKSPKKPPNVTVQNKEGHFKINYEAFDSREHYILGDFKQKETDEIIRLQERHEERDITNLRSLKSQQICEIVDSDRLVFNRENTDGKLQIFTQIEKNKDYSPIVGNAMTLNDIRNLEREVGREVRNDLQGEGIETVFFERLSAYCNNIPAV
ncbi:jg11440 [Pararge aegeria aegeria]|uniref:Jg11440 protein n=1 Tax=Pararge aegeria aegeria TaxID=348720 RepID=A0A8S4RY41_9NEOP|nr:jg11440 [Pararge aegeria aegeria]